MADESPAQAEASPETPHAEKTADELREELVRSNAENAGRRHEIERLEARLQKIERDNESEWERRDRESEERGRAAAKVDHDVIVAQYEQRLVVKDIEAKAGPVFADPGDAVAQLEHTGVLSSLLEISDPSKRDQAVAKALEELLQAKPYLAREQQNHRPLVSQGARSEQTGRRERSWLRG